MTPLDLVGFKRMYIFKFAYMGKFRWPYRSVPIPTTTFRPANIILQPQPQPQPQPAEQVEDQAGQAEWVEYWVGLVEVEAGWGWGTAY